MPTTDQITEITPTPGDGPITTDNADGGTHTGEPDGTSRDDNPDGTAAPVAATNHCADTPAATARGSRAPVRIGLDERGNMSDEPVESDADGATGRRLGRLYVVHNDTEMPPDDDAADPCPAILAW